MINKYYCFSYKSNPLTQLKWLLWRNAMAIIREPFSFIVQLVQAFVRLFLL